MTIDEAPSEDKAEDLGADRMGYRAVHLVGTIRSDRVMSLEWTSFRDLLFEVQVTTVLQHGWAEFEHDRGYKFIGGELRLDLKRRLRLVAAMLESADLEIDRLAVEIEAYERSVREDSNEPDRRGRATDRCSQRAFVART